MAAAGSPALTNEQRAAIETRHISVALSAGAGCGKTFVLTERFLSHLDVTRGQPARLSELVAITFTERAAREMRDRIREKCHDRLLDADDDRHADHWLELLRDLDSARVSTIHSFCGSLLRAHAVEAALDPHFQVYEQSESNAILSELIDDVLREQLARRHEPLMRMVLRFGLDGLRTMVARVLAGRHVIDFESWAKESPESLVMRWKTYHADIAPTLARRKLARSRAVRVLRDLLAVHEPTNAVMQARCLALREALPRLEEEGDPGGLFDVLLDNARVQGGGGKSAWPDDTVYRLAQKACEDLRKEVTKARADLEFDANAALAAAEAGLDLLEITAPIAEAYAARKRDLGVLDFNDLLAKAGALLLDPAHARLREALSEQIELLLVDEFQDTDPLQVQLVEALCGSDVAKGKLFFVGDHKQSIYRFRGADPRVFRGLRERLPEEGRLPLARNFRSRPEILAFVNALFCDVLGPGYEPLTAHRLPAPGVPAVEFLWAVEKPESEETTQPNNEGATDDKKPRSSADELRRREADWIARRLRRMLDSGERLIADDPEHPGVARPARQGDIAILFRALTNVAHYEDALRREGIDYYLVGGHAFYSQQEVFDLVNLLRAVSMPADEVSLVGVLRSPFFSLADETLYWLSRHGDGLSAGLFAEKLPARLDSKQAERVRFAAATLNELRAIKDRVPVATLINEALARTGYDAALVADFLGTRKLANLRKLVDKARAFDGAKGFTLDQFLTDLSESVARQPDEALAATHAESADVVRLMTIHQSKGLEFPVVVVPDLERQHRANSEPSVFDPELGPLVRTKGGRQGSVSSGMALYEMAQLEEDEAERVRLLYVATTRAADYLILSSGVDEPGEPRGPWRQLLGERFDLESGELVVTLPSGYEPPRVVVTRERPKSARDAAPSKRHDLVETISEARQLASAKTTAVPATLARVPVDADAPRWFSFSRLTGQVSARTEPSEEADEPGEPTDWTEPIDARVTTRATSSDAAATSRNEDKRREAQALGTLVHAALEVIDFANPGPVGTLLQDLAQRKFDKNDEPIEVAAELIEQFLASPRCGALRAADRCERELDFIMRWPLEVNAPPRCYLQGVIDCLYQDESGQWHLLDYKTNQVTSERIAAEAAEYEAQMLIYALAVEQVLDEPPASLVLHFLRPGGEHEFPWNDAARRRAIELVEGGIESLVVKGR